MKAIQDRWQGGRGGSSPPPRKSTVGNFVKKKSLDVSQQILKIDDLFFISLVDIFTVSKFEHFSQQIIRYDPPYKKVMAPALKL